MSVKPLPAPPVPVNHIAIAKAKLELEKAKRLVPDLVIEVVNRLLTEAYCESTGVAEVKLHIIRLKVREAMVAADKELLPDQGLLSNIDVPTEWMDFEPLYREAGWKCAFHKAPYYMENASYFSFERPRA